MRDWLAAVAWERLWRGCLTRQLYGDGGDAIRFGHGSVWLSNLRAANIWRLDPKRIVATMPE